MQTKTIKNIKLTREIQIYAAAAAREPSSVSISANEAASYSGTSAGITVTLKTTFATSPTRSGKSRLTMTAAEPDTLPKTSRYDWFSPECMTRVANNSDVATSPEAAASHSGQVRPRFVPTETRGRQQRFRILKGGRSAQKKT